MVNQKKVRFTPPPEPVLGPDPPPGEPEPVIPPTKRVEPQPPPELMPGPEPPLPKPYKPPSPVVVPTPRKIFIHSKGRLTKDQLGEIEKLGVKVQEGSWIPPVSGHPTGFVTAEMGSDVRKALLSLNYIVKVDSAERELQPSVPREGIPGPWPPPGAQKIKLPGKISSPGFEWEVQKLIDTGVIPPPPKEREYITTVAPYWTGKEWTAKTRPGFEGIPLEISPLLTPETKLPLEFTPPATGPPGTSLAVEDVGTFHYDDKGKLISLRVDPPPKVTLGIPKLQTKSETTVTLGTPRLGKPEVHQIGITKTDTIWQKLEALKREPFYSDRQDLGHPYGFVIGFDTELSAWRTIQVLTQEEAERLAMENFETDKYIIVWSSKR